MSLENLDTVIAFAVIMLLLSLLITVLVQMVVAVLHMRGMVLVWGIRQLLETVDPALTSHAKEIADAILRHQTVSPGGLGFYQRATAIRAEELVRVLGAVTSGGGKLGGEARAALKAACLEGAGKDAALVISQCFSSVMDRCTERFVLGTRWATIVMAALIAFVLQIDSLQILRTLSSSGEIRARIMGSANILDEKTKAAADESLGDELDENMKDHLKDLAASARDLRTQLEQSSLTIVPASWPNLTWTSRTVAGTIMSFLLLSLGAPFWFNLLRTLSNLRPILANKVEADESAKREK